MLEQLGLPEIINFNYSPLDSKYYKSKYHAKWQRDNREKYNGYMRKWQKDKISNLSSVELEKLRTEEKEYRQKNYDKNYKKQQDWKKNNPERDNKLNYQERERLKTEIFKHYSEDKMCCVKCGFSDIRALQLDHIYDNGSEHRRLIGGVRTRAGGQYYRWLRKNKFPEGYQVLCANCNWIKEHDRRKNESKDARKRYCKKNNVAL